MAMALVWPSPAAAIRDGSQWRDIRMCRYCMLRLIGSPSEQDPRHPDNWRRGTGNGSHDPSTCRALLRCLCKGGDESVSNPEIRLLISGCVTLRPKPGRSHRLQPAYHAPNDLGRGKRVSTGWLAWGDQREVKKWAACPGCARKFRHLPDALQHLESGACITIKKGGLAMPCRELFSRGLMSLVAHSFGAICSECVHGRSTG